jgi:hypothetical protein
VPKQGNITAGFIGRRIIKKNKRFFQRRLRLWSGGASGFFNGGSKYAALLALFCGLAAPLFCQNDEPVSLDKAVSGSMAYIAERLDQGTRVAVLNFAAPPAVSSYVMEESAAFLVKDENLVVVERGELELLQEEMDFQLSGEVSDESAQSIGKMLGAQVIISGSFAPLGGMWRMRIKALEVETAHIRSISSYTVKNDSLLNSLLPRRPKTSMDKIGTGALNIVFGLGSWLEGDAIGGLSISAGSAAAAALFVVEAAALDWNSPAVGVPAAVGVSVAGLTLAYGFIRPFIYNRSPDTAEFMDNIKIESVPAPRGDNNPHRDAWFRLSYSFSVR